MVRESREQRLFELFNEIGIISQLASTEFNRHLPEAMHVSHFSVVNHLCRLGDGRTPLQIAQAFQVSKPTITHTLAKLSERHLVEVRANPADGRSKLVFLTARGREFRDQAIATLEPVLASMAKQLDTTRLLTALPALRELREHLDRHRSE